MTRARAWTFTINNPPLRSAVVLGTMGCNYIVYQEEKGAKNGTTHIQGYVVFNSAKSLNDMRILMPGGAHLEIARGTAAQNRVYCTKEETRVGNGIKGEYGILYLTIEGWPDLHAGERGEMPEQGKRVDLEKMKKSIDDGASLDEMWEEHFAGMVRYGRAMREYMAQKSGARARQTLIRVFWGSTGTGKSHKAHEEAARLNPGYTTMAIQEKGKMWANPNKWGVMGEVVVMDDFMGEVNYRVLLQMLDKFPCQVPTKGGFAEWAPKYIFITSNAHPKDWYANIGTTVYEGGPLQRRLESAGSFVKEFNTVYKEPHRGVDAWVGTSGFVSGWTSHNHNLGVTFVPEINTQPYMGDDGIVDIEGEPWQDAQPITDILQSSDEDEEIMAAIQ